MSPKLRLKWPSVMKRLLVITTAALALAFGVAPAGAATDWNVGDIFAGVSNGQYTVYDNGGTFKETLSDGLGGFTTGCAFNPALDKLYTTNFSTSNVVVYDNASPHASTPINTAAQGGGNAESIVFASNGDFYVGHAGGNADIQRYNAAGTYQQSYNVGIERRGSDWIDLAADQQTMFYTSEGRNVFRYDVAGDAQLANFAALPGSGIAFALRLLAPGDGSGGLLVADDGDVKRLDGAGNVIQTYDVTGEDTWFSLNLDPDGTSFWAGNYGSGKAYRFDIATGGVDNQIQTLDTGAPGLLFGLCLKGEPTAAVPTISVTGRGRFNTSGGGRVDFTLSNETVTFERSRGERFSFAGEVDSISGSDNTATLMGTGTWNGADGYTFEVTVVDNGSPGTNKDTIAVVIRDAAGVIVFIQGPELLKPGDIVVTSPEPT